MRVSGNAERFFVVLLLTAFAGLALHSMSLKSPTFDETAHLGAGVSYVQTGDYRLNPEHPALPKMLAGAAASAAGARAYTDSEAWQRSDQWDFGSAVLYDSGADWRRLLFLGRLPMVAIGVALGAMLWIWARMMIGGAGAAVVLTLYAFSPNFLAHTRLVTTDVPLSFAVTGVAACLWAAWRSGRWTWTIAASAFVALSMVSKYSAFSWTPVWLLLALLPSKARPLNQCMRHAGLLVAASAVFTMLFIAATYGFSLDFTTIQSLGMEGRGIRPEDMAWSRRLPYEVMARVPWPSREFAAGLKDVLLYVEAGHPVYLLGQRAEAGWWWSPFVAWGSKTPVPFLALTAFALLSLLWRRSLRRADVLFLLAPAGLVLLTNMVAKLGLGVRHLMPMFPFLMLFAAWPLRAAGFRAGAYSLALLVVLLGSQMVGTLRAHPHYLPYFNFAVGGPRGGLGILGDSNLDWGQDLSLVAEELRARNASGAILSYFGTANPFAESLDWQLMPPTRRDRKLDPWTVLPEDGDLWLVMSATNRQGVYSRGPGAERGTEVLYPWLDSLQPAAVVGESIFLYDITHKLEAQKNIFRISKQNGLREEAEALLRRMVAGWVYERELRLELVQLHISRGELEEANRLLLRTPNPESEDVILLANIREQLDDVKGVRRAFETGVNTFPSAADIYNSYAWFLQERNLDLDQALQLTEKALEWQEGDPYYLDTQGMVYRARGEAEQAAAVFAAALQAAAGQPALIPTLRWHQALAWYDSGRIDEAMAEAEALLDMESSGPELQDEISAWLAGQGR